MKNCLCYFGLFALLACQQEKTETPSYELSMDHHVHIQSKAAAEHMDVLLRLFRMKDSARVSEPTTAETVLSILDSSSIRQAAVLSSGYMFGIPDLEVENELEKVRAENEYVATQANQSERLFGFCSVNPAKPYALEEVERCFDSLKVDGLKLHLANSKIDFFNEEHMQRLQKIFDLCVKYDKPVLMHMRNRNPEYGAVDVKEVLENLLIPRKDLRIVIAHAAGWGGFDAATDSALRTFIPYFESGALSSENIRFGMGYVVYETGTASVDSTAIANLSLAMKAVGIEKFVFASDWSFGSAIPGAYQEKMEHWLDLSAKDWETLRANRGFGFE